MLTRFLGAVAAFGLIASLAQAFEPGTDRVCTASADGQRFECHDKSDVAATPTAPKPAATRTAETAPVDAPARSAPASSAPFAAPAPAASDVPNYLLQPSRPSRPVRRAKPAVAEAPPARKPAADAMPARAQATTVETPSTASPSTLADDAKVERADAMPIEQKPVAQRKTSSTPPAASPVSVAQTPAAPMKAPAAIPAPPAQLTNIASARDFLELPANHYTLVLASVRNARALDALILALDTLPGQLYLLKLSMPDGDWYSLCWSEFDNLDAARSARATLPANAAITSGWPRKIGLLQKEIAR
ncbi:MAG TPA: hypothetical protein VFN25_03220 [Dokdonella sp.]|uniref:hypothetical protein n=1 Tax=Dokdonella sp. TaxID=2291710 RepID=UPI002D7FE103|nr:hypothetical protein [Dokdonella sp.]HET9031896.1 hypothetical protein [Dokdonella sp.]